MDFTTPMALIAMLAAPEQNLGVPTRHLLLREARVGAQSIPDQASYCIIGIGGHDIGKLYTISFVGGSYDLLTVEAHDRAIVMGDVAPLVQAAEAGPIQGRACPNGGGLQVLYLAVGANPHNYTLLRQECGARLLAGGTSAAGTTLSEWMDGICGATP
jgi:hypothetical protein